ncbi:MAG: aminotransferase class I/II-fold pyridoxal phosphate-dependent enzyme [Oligoflexia bacterium]|nr:aminotransferase class I/II-fold pyridoxal phosphate-dependent enzyme [Oligoflexia bacterium]
MENNILREDVDCVIDFLKADIPILTQSSKVREFEQEWSKWLGVKHSVFVNSGSSANFVTMAIIKELYGEGEVIVPPLTWVSDIVSVLKAGMKPVFADINLRNLGMDTDEILKKVTKNTKAVFLTHILGFNALNSKLVSELKERNIPLIEDVCESHGATYKGIKLGSYGLISNFSFYYAHHLSTIEGGMICSNDDRIFQMARIFRSHGMVREATDENLKQSYIVNYPDLSPDFIFAYQGNNFRSTELNAVIGLQQIKRLDDNNDRRRANFKLFLENLDPKKYHTDFDVEGSCNYAFVLMLKRPDLEFCNRVMSSLKQAGVEFRRGTSGGGNQLRQPYLQGIVPADYYKLFPNTEHVHSFGFYIGNFPILERDLILKLCQLLNCIE